MKPPRQGLQEAGREAARFLRSLNGRDAPAYIVQTAREHADDLESAILWDDGPSGPPVARPIFQTGVTLWHFSACAFFILAGLAGVSMNVPPIGLAMTGAIWLFPAAASAALTWQHWRLAAALKALAKARGSL
jgi:hypothetical protein